MKDNSRIQRTRKSPNLNKVAAGLPNRTVGIDLGDKTSHYCILDEFGDVVSEGTVRTTELGLHEQFGAMKPARVVVESGTHSPWVSRCLQKLGHAVWVANARQVRLIYESDRKSDQLDARSLARLARADPSLLHPIQHRTAQAQADLAVIRARDVVVSARTKLINCARGMVKSAGGRLPSACADSFGGKVRGQLPASLEPAVKPLLDAIEHLTEKIREYDRQIEELARKKYPETERLRQIGGVGVVTSLAFVLTIDDPQRFRKSRDVGCYLGLRPKQSDSGSSQPQLGISKAGNPLLRRLLVHSAHYVLGQFGPDCDLRRWGLSLMTRGGKNAKKRAVVAVARKLAVRMHRLWVSGEGYEPLRVSSALGQPENRGSEVAPAA